MLRAQESGQLRPDVVLQDIWFVQKMVALVMDTTRGVSQDA